jgi:hypothetical protein
LNRVLAILPTLALLVLLPAAEAREPSVKKGIWGPVTHNGVSQFPIYRELGAGVYHTRLRWHEVAASRPARPRDPRDPTYRWPAELSEAVRQARRYGMRVAVEVQGIPRWANGNRPSNWVPDQPGDFADFMGAAARKYKGVKYWVVWGEPTRRPNFMPLARTDSERPLTRRQSRGPRTYARILDASYSAIKRANRRAYVVGGNSFTKWRHRSPQLHQELTAALRAPAEDGPLGHNPFSARRPDLSDDLIREGMADSVTSTGSPSGSDRSLGSRPNGKKIKLWLGEYFIPTDHQNAEFGWWVTRATQASWLRSALRIVRRWDRIATLNWLSLATIRPTRQATRRIEA